MVSLNTIHYTLYITSALLAADVDVDVHIVLIMNLTLRPRTGYDRRCEKRADTDCQVSRWPLPGMQLSATLS